MLCSALLVLERMRGSAGPGFDPGLTGVLDCDMADASLSTPALPTDPDVPEGESPGDASLAAIRDAVAAWRRGPVAEALRKVPPRKDDFSTWSGAPVPDLVTPAEQTVDHDR